MQNKSRRMRLTDVRRMRIMRRMRFADVLKSLAARKGDGSWLMVAKLAGVHYDTVARIARGDMKTPSVQAVERIAAALEQLDAESSKAT